MVSSGQYWPISLAAVIVAHGICQAAPVKAQIIPDTTLGAAASTFEANNTIQGGLQRDANLFHSFDSFNIQAGEQINFAPDNNIESIFTRVTGNTASEILGILGVNNEADLFLINPNGITMGPDAELDMEGSFLAATADGIAFGPGFTFSATTGNVPPDNLLVVQPSALIFSALTPAPINSQAKLEVGNGQRIQLVGGEVNLFPDTIKPRRVDLRARGGAVEIGGIAVPGTVNFSPEGNLLFPEDVSRADVNLTRVRIRVANRGNGDINIYGNDINLKNSQLSAGYRSNRGETEQPAGDIFLEATGDIALTDSRINSQLDQGTTGIRGNIILAADGNIELQDSLIESQLIGVGSGGILELIAGGDLIIDTSRIVSLINRRGTVNGEGAEASGAINIQATSLLMTTAEGTPRTRQSIISTTTSGDGDGGVITINADRLTMIGPGESGSSGITASAGTRDTPVNAGSVFITVNGPISLTKRAKIETILQGRATGRAGNIVINAESLELNNDVSVTARNRGVGEAGNVTILLSGALSVTGNSSINANADGRFNENQTVTTETTGNLVIVADTITLTRQGSINVSTSRGYDAGQIDITANVIDLSDVFILGKTRTSSSGFFSRSRPTADGAGGDIRVQAGLLRITGNAVINTSTESSLSGGNIELVVDRLELLDGGQLVASTSGESGAGDILVTASDEILISGSDPSFASQFENAERLLRERDIANLRDVVNREGANGLVANNPAPSGIFTITEGAGAAGNIVIGEPAEDALNLNLNNGGTISARGLGEGDAGGIIITLSGELMIVDSDIRTDAAQSAGGAITIDAGNILMTGDGDIFTNVASGAGNGGDINIAADFLIALDDSDILAFAQDGAGGNITLPAFFGQNFIDLTNDSDPNSLDRNGRVDVNATGQLSSGTITFPDVSFIGNSLTELPETLINTDSLVATSCIAPVAEGSGRLVLAGKEGIPQQPGDALRSVFQTSDIQALPSVTVAATPTDTSVSSETWTPGTPITEPDAIYQLTDGRWVMGQNCQRSSS